MFTHEQIWTAIEHLARSNQMSPSGLARASGLDPTSFNRSKRISPNGKKRWPTTESLSKVLSVVNVSLEEFAIIATREGITGPSVPLIGLAQAGDSGFFDDAGFPVGGSWEEIRIPSIHNENVYALEIAGDSMLPVFRHGDTVLVAPGEEVRKGDRVVLKSAEGEVMAKELVRITDKVIEVRSVNPEFEDRVFKPSEVSWIARIVWATQ